MSIEVQVAIAVVVAGALAAIGPTVIARLPEPAEPAADKVAYREVAQRPRALAWMVLPAMLAVAPVAWAVGVPELLPVWILLAGVGAWLAFVDWHTQYLPFRLTVPLHLAVWVAVGVAALLLRDVDLVIRAVIANVVVYAVFVLLHVIGNRFFRGGFGFGDVRLAAIVAVALAPQGAAAVGVGLYAGFAIGAVLGLVFKRVGVIEGDSFAFGPYLLMGAAVGAAWGPTAHLM